MDGTARNFTGEFTRAKLRYRGRYGSLVVSDLAFNIVLSGRLRALGIID